MSILILLLFATNTATINFSLDPPKDKAVVGYKILWRVVGMEKGLWFKFDIGKETKSTLECVTGFSYEFSALSYNKYGVESYPAKKLEIGLPESFTNTKDFRLYTTSHMCSLISTLKLGPITVKKKKFSSERWKSNDHTN